MIRDNPTRATVGPMTTSPLPHEGPTSRCVFVAGVVAFTRTVGLYANPAVPTVGAVRGGIGASLKHPASVVEGIDMCGAGPSNVIPKLHLPGGQPSSKFDPNRGLQQEVVRVEVTLTEGLGGNDRGKPLLTNT